MWAKRFDRRQCDYCRDVYQPTNSTNRWCSVECRFWSHVDKSAGPDKCWPWTKGAFETGYGQFSVDGDALYAHRQCLIFSGVVIPPGHYGIHVCDNPPCCNPHPKHVIVGTPSDNVNDMYAKGRQGDRNYAAGDRHGMRRLKLKRLTGGL